MLYVLEGPDGVGKSTIARMTAQSLRAAGVPCAGLSFPGAEPGSLGGLVYRLHNVPNAYELTGIDPCSLQLLHVAAHIDAIERQIKPLVDAGQIVLLDRYWWSTWVYGSTAGVHGRSLDAMIALEKLHWGSLIPAAIFLVRRDSPLVDSEMQEQDRLVALYNALAHREGMRNNIIHVLNDQEIGVAVGQIMAVITGSPS